MKKIIIILLILVGCKADLPIMKDYPNNLICFEMDKCLTLNTYNNTVKIDCTNLILKCFKHYDYIKCQTSTDKDCLDKLQVRF